LIYQLGTVKIVAELAVWAVRKGLKKYDPPQT